ncbi:MAG: ADP-ribosylglycohydrolase family protein, partial [Leuconostoc fallax]
MAKKQTMIERTLLAMAVGESLAYLPSSKQEILVHQPDNFTDPLKWGANTSMSLATVSSLSRGYQFNDVMLRLQNWYKRRQYAPAQTIQSIDDVIQSSMLRFSKNRDLLASGGVDEASNSDSVLAR